jgi:glycosyltransferase involved in cell wall biosynthesis
METRKKRVMLHLIMPNQISGPNQSNRKIFESQLNEEFEFAFLRQEYLAGGRLNIRLVNDLCKQIKRFKPDLVHLSGMQSSCFHAVLACRLAGVDNILIGVRGFSSDDTGISKSKKFVFDHFVEPMTMMLSRNFYTVSKTMSNYALVRRFSSKYLGTVHNVIPHIQESSDEQTRIELGLNTGDVVTVIVGRIVKDKGIEFIIDAIKKTENPNIKFVFIGDGPYYRNIVDLLSDDISKKRVILTGKVNDTYRYLRVANIFLFATLHENLSNALLEAAVYKLACVVTDVGGNVEVVQHQTNGLLIRAKNSDDIVDALNFLMANPDKISEYGANIAKTVQDKFSRQEHFTKIRNIYLTMLEYYV